MGIKIEREIEIFELDWRGITLSVSFEPDWLGIGKDAYGAPLAHIEVRVIRPENARLAITETGYRSYFLFPVSIHETDLMSSRREDFWFIVAARSEDETETRAGQSAGRASAEGHPASDAPAIFG